MQNKPEDLMDFMMAQIEAISNPELTAEELDLEIKRSKSISDMSDKVLRFYGFLVKNKELNLEYGIKANDDFGMLGCSDENSK